MARPPSPTFPLQIPELLFQFIIYQQKGMLIQKQNFLNIDYERGRGLKLNWDFKDILGREKYFRHLIVAMDHDSSSLSLFLDAFYRRMKQGDILSCLYLRRDGEVKLCPWVQKTHIHKFNSQKYVKSHCNTTIDNSKKILLLQRAGSETLQFSDPVVVNVLMQHSDQPKFYQDLIRQARSSRNEFSYIVNLFGRVEESRISIHSGINIFKATPETLNELTQFYHNFINNAVIPFARIKIECLNGQMGLYNESYWSNADFNSIEATYYGPSSQFSHDQLVFYIQDLTREISIHLQITLQMRLFSGKKYESVKKVHLSYSYEKDGSLTMHEIKCPSYKVFKNIYLADNPYQCSTIVKLFHKVENKSFEIL